MVDNSAGACDGLTPPQCPSAFVFLNVPFAATFMSFEDS
jgi:hypothetical protein